METKSTNEVKGDYDRVSASECLGSLIELHGIVMEDDLFVIPDADGTAVLYMTGRYVLTRSPTSRSARCLWASCSATAICSTFPVPNRSRRAYTRMAGGVQSLKFLPVALPDISGVNCTGSWATIRRSIDGKQKNRTVVVRFFSRRIFTAVACRVPVSAFAGRAVAATCRHGFPPRYAPRASGRDLRGTPGIGVPPLLSR